MSDDDFWVTYTSVTPNEDKDFAPREPNGCWGWLLAIGGLLGWIVLYCLI